jgi:hypothetical protein
VAHAEANVLYEMDQITQRVVAAVMDRQATAVAGDSLPVPEATKRVGRIVKS